jgi:hypothetical protein
VQFRKWATRVATEFTIKGFAMDDERLKRGGSVLSASRESCASKLGGRHLQPVAARFRYRQTDERVL